MPFTTAFLLVWFGFGYALPSALHGATASSPTELASLQLGLESLKAGATAWLCLSSPFRPPRAWLALDAAPRQPAAATAALAAAGALACTLFATLASLGAHGGMSPSPPPEAVALALQPASALAAVAVAPLVEEAVFRGVLQRSLLAAGVAPPLAVAAQAAAFAGLHLGRGGWDAAGLLGVGAALGATAAAAAAGGGGLAVPVCAHALFNAGALASLARGG